MSAVLLGYVEHCEKCGQPAMLTEQTPGWVCPACSGAPPAPADELIYDRATVLLRRMLDTVAGQLQPSREDALLDTSDDLNDEEPEPGQLRPGEA